MNRILKFLPLLLVLLVLTSCKTQNVTFSGRPGTKIYNHNYIKVGEVNNSGSATVKLLYKTKPVRFMLYKDLETDALIPYALNLNPKYETGQIVGISLLPVGVLAWAAALNSMNPIALGGGAAAYLGGMILLYGSSKRYIPEQTIPQDIVFTPLVETADYKTFVPKAQRMNAQPKNGSQRVNTTRRSGNSRYKADDDHTKNVIGTYIGNGKLMFEGAVTEKYNDIKVVIEKVSGEANMVTVNVMLDDGNPYFGSKSKYSITKNDDEYVLIHESVNSTISINQYGELVYLNNDVEDDNGINILKINADKE